MFGTSFVLEEVSAVFSSSHSGPQHPALHVSVGHGLYGGQGVLGQQVGHVGGDARHLEIPALGLSFKLSLTNLLTGARRVVSVGAVIDYNPMNLSEFPEVLRPFEKFGISDARWQARHEHQVGLNNSSVGVWSLPLVLDGFNLPVWLLLFLAAL